MKSTTGDSGVDPMKGQMKDSINDSIKASSTTSTSAALSQAKVFAGKAFVTVGFVAASQLLLPVFSSTQVASAQEWEPPMTSWGEPDLQGMWPLNPLISTSVVRDPQYGDRFYLNDDELTQAAASTAARDERFQGGEIPVADAAGRQLNQTSLIFFPEDGSFPELTEYGKDLQANLKGSYHPTQTVFDKVEDFSAWDRCITRGLPVSMLARNYNNGLRIVQSPGYVAIQLEMAHEVRIIPTDGRPPLDSQIKQWLGESRGHWEGNTLVVETTNFNGRTQLTSAGNPGSPRDLQPSTENMRIIERFTRVADDRIDYDIQIEDPTIFVDGYYIMKYPMFLDNDYEMFEYACHEGNTAVRYYIETSRYEREQSGEL